MGYRESISETTDICAAPAPRHLKRTGDNQVTSVLQIKTPHADDGCVKVEEGAIKLEEGGSHVERTRLDGNLRYGGDTQRTPCRDCVAYRYGSFGRTLMYVEDVECVPWASRTPGKVPDQARLSRASPTIALSSPSPASGASL